MIPWHDTCRLLDEYMERVQRFRTATFPLLSSDDAPCALKYRQARLRAIDARDELRQVTRDPRFSRAMRAVLTRTVRCDASYVYGGDSVSDVQEARADEDVGSKRLREYERRLHSECPSIWTKDQGLEGRKRRKRRKKRKRR